MPKFQVNDKIKTKPSAGYFSTGVIIDIQLPGEYISINGKPVRSGTSAGLETRYQIKWDGTKPRTWFRESGLEKA